MPDHHLKPSESLRQPELRRRGELFAIEKGKTKGRVQRNARARAAEQPPHRHPENFALQVPQREVDCRDRVQRIARLPARAEQPVEVLPETLRIQRVLADERGPGDEIHDRAYRFLLGNAGNAVPDEAALAFDLDHAHRQGTGLV